MITSRIFSSDAHIAQGVSYFVGSVEVHIPATGRPEVFVAQQAIDAGQLAETLPALVELFTDPVVCAEILRARACK